MLKLSLNCLPLFLTLAHTHTHTHKGTYTHNSLCFSLTHNTHINTRTNTHTLCFETVAASAFMHIAIIHKTAALATSRLAYLLPKWLIGSLDDTQISCFRRTQMLQTAETRNKTLGKKIVETFGRLSKILDLNESKLIAEKLYEKKFNLESN